MATLKIETESSDLKKVEDSFDNLTKAQQKMVLANSALGKQMQDSKEKQKLMNKELKEAEKMNPFNRMAAGLKGFIAAYAGMKGLQAINDQLNRSAEMTFQDMLRRNKEASEAAKNRGAAVGDVLANNMDLLNNPKLAREVTLKLTDAAIEVGEKDVNKMIAQYSSVVSQTSSVEGITENDRIEALKYAKMYQRIVPSSDPAKMASSYATLAKSEGISIDKSAGLLSSAASFTDLDASKFSESARTMLNQKIKGISSEDILLWLSAANASTGGDKPEPSKEAVVRAIGKLSTMENFQAGDNRYNVKGKSIDEKMATLLNAAAELSVDDRNKFIEEELRLTGTDNTFFTYLIANKDKFFQRRETLLKSASGGYMAQMTRSFKNLNPTYEASLKADQMGGLESGLTSTNTKGAVADILFNESMAMAKSMGVDIKRKPLWDGEGDGRVAGIPVNRSIENRVRDKIAEMQSKNVDEFNIRKEVRDMIFEESKKSEIRKVREGEPFPFNLPLINNPIENKALNPDLYKKDLNFFQGYMLEPMRNTIETISNISRYEKGKGEFKFKNVGAGIDRSATGTSIDEYGSGSEDYLSLVKFSDGISAFEQAVIKLSHTSETLDKLLNNAFINFEGQTFSTTDDAAVKKFLRAMEQTEEYKNRSNIPFKFNPPAKIKQEDIQ